jgi:hypothetical protein
MIGVAELKTCVTTGRCYACARTDLTVALVKCRDIQTVSRYFVLTLTGTTRSMSWESMMNHNTGIEMIDSTAKSL